METYTKLKEFTKNPQYQMQRQQCLGSLSDHTIDAPLVGIIDGFNKLPFCFTLQCCCGHFVYNGQKDPHNREPLPTKEIPAGVKYRIAYIAFCIENSASGRKLFEAFKEVPAIDPENVQFCCAAWFWEHQVNSYALQVEPERFKDKDTAILDYKQALHIERIRNEFFKRLEVLLKNMGA